MNVTSNGIVFEGASAASHEVMLTCAYQNDLIAHMPPRQQPQGHVCDYCRTISTAERCPSCGAPRTARRANPLNDAIAQHKGWNAQERLRQRRLA